MDCAYPYHIFKISYVCFSIELYKDEHFTFNNKQYNGGLIKFHGILSM